MKKIISLIATISIAVTCISCNPNSQPKSNPYVESAKKYGYYHIFNVSYGMLFDECLDALGVTEDEIKVLTPEEMGNEPDDLKNQGFALFDLVVYNQNAYAVFLFDNYLYKSGYVLGLREIRLIFDDQLTFNKLTSEIENDLVEKNISFDIGTNITGGPSYYNTKKLDSIEDDETRNNVADLTNEVFYDWIPDKTLATTIDKYRLDEISIMIYPDTQKVAHVSIYSKIAPIIGIVNNRYH